MRKQVLLSIVFALMGVLAIQGRDVVSRAVQVAPFDKIVIASSVTVRYTQSAKYGCTIVGSKQDIGKIRVEVKSGVLDIRVQTKKAELFGVTFQTAEDIDDVVINVSSPCLTKVQCLGSGDFIATNDIRTDNLECKVAGSGDIGLKTVTAQNLRLDIAGSGDISLQQARVQRLSAAVAGSGDINIGRVVSGCQDATLAVVGSGDVEAEFALCERLVCKVAGSGDIQVRGKVTHHEVSVIGSGDIDDAQLCVTGKRSEHNVRAGSQSRKPNRINSRP